ncbi:MAG: hypothetical protein RIF33_00105 [Cyclobacteriaceae bacterium]
MVEEIEYTPEWQSFTQRLIAEADEKDQPDQNWVLTNTIGENNFGYVFREQQMFDTEAGLQRIKKRIRQSFFDNIKKS